MPHGILFHGHWLRLLRAASLCAAVGLLTMFHPNDTLVKWLAAVGLPLLIVGIWRHAHIGSPKEIIREEEGPVDSSVDLAELAAEAKREM